MPVPRPVGWHTTGLTNGSTEAGREHEALWRPVPVETRSAVNLFVKKIKRVGTASANFENWLYAVKRGRDGETLRAIEPDHPPLAPRGLQFLRLSKAARTEEALVGFEASESAVALVGMDGFRLSRVWRGDGVPVEAQRRDVR